MGVHASSSKSNYQKKTLMSKLPQGVKDGVSDEIPVASEDQVTLSLSEESVFLPNEIIIVVLSFLSIEDLQNCLRTCRLFRDLTLSSSLWKMKCIREKKFPDNIGSYYPSDWRNFYLKQPFTRNLIRNASGQSKFPSYCSTVQCEILEMKSRYSMECFHILYVCNEYVHPEFFCAW